MATVLLSIWINTFFGIYKRAIWRLNYTYGSSHIASSAYQKWPTEPNVFNESAHRSSTLHAHLKFENRQKEQNSPKTLIIRFTAHNNIILVRYPERNFGGNQLPDGSISLSPLYSS